MLLGALAEGGGALVGVAAVAPDVSLPELDRLVAAGVRGVRMAHFEAGDLRAMGGFVPFNTLGTPGGLEKRLAERTMHLQLFTDSRLLPALEERLMRFPVPVFIDHMGRAPASLGARHEGIRSLARLMRDGPAKVDISAHRTRHRLDIAWRKSKQRPSQAEPGCVARARQFDPHGEAATAVVAPPDDTEVTFPADRLGSEIQSCPASRARPVVVAADPTSSG